jgi:hypothetical protein
VDSYHPRKHLREEPLGIAQKRALTLYASKLLEQGEGEDFRVREPLYGLVASSMGVEQGVGVVYEAEESTLRASSRWSGEWLCWARAIQSSFR